MTSGREEQAEPGVTVRTRDGRHEVYAPVGTPAGEFAFAVARLVPDDAVLAEVAGGDDFGEMVIVFRSPDAPAAKSGTVGGGL